MKQQMAINRFALLLVEKARRKGGEKPREKKTQRERGGGKEERKRRKTSFRPINKHTEWLNENDFDTYSHTVERDDDVPSRS